MAAAERNVSARSKWFVASLRNACAESESMCESLGLSSVRTIDTAADIARASNRSAAARSFLEALVIGLFFEFQHSRGLSVRVVTDTITT